MLVLQHMSKIILASALTSFIEFFLLDSIDISHNSNKKMLDLQAFQDCLVGYQGPKHVCFTIMNFIIEALLLSGSHFKSTAVETSVVKGNRSTINIFSTTFSNIIIICNYVS